MRELQVDTHSVFAKVGRWLIELDAQDRKGDTLTYCVVVVIVSLMAGFAAWIQWGTP